MWQPSASTELLRFRAKLLADCRRFFVERQVMEVDPPSLGFHTVTDPHLESFSLQQSAPHQSPLYFLQTSPEFYMKRLLAAGSGDIYALGKAFRREEQGTKHLQEFTLLEWYRESIDNEGLAREVVELIRFVAGGRSLEVRWVSYRECFQQVTGLDPHTASTAKLAQYAQKKMDLNFSEMNRSAWLDLLFSQCVEPNLTEGLYVIEDYPVCQSALARLGHDREGTPVAKRFEIFWNGTELANGYWELQEAQEQRERFEKDLQLRQALQKTTVALDEAFLGALDFGLPDCSGVALGLDRLLMCLTEEKDIRKVVGFPI